MKPPICELCGTEFDPDAATVRFSDYRALPDGMVGHPDGLVWFCGTHIDAARSLAHLPEAEALARLSAEGGSNSS
jgi:hypothetical protein